MIYLNNGFFKPMLIIVSVIVFPLLIGCFICILLDYRIELFITSITLFFVYGAIICALYKYSKTKKFYMFAKNNDSIFVKYPNLNTRNFIEIDLCDIRKMEYYKISSIRAWGMLCNYVCPQCVYITYESEGKEVCKHIGYPNLKELSSFCFESGINLVIK